jgi:hypothetical protein
VTILKCSATGLSLYCVYNLTPHSTHHLAILRGERWYIAAFQPQVGPLRVLYLTIEIGEASISEKSGTQEIMSINFSAAFTTESPGTIPGRASDSQQPDT